MCTSAVRVQSEALWDRVCIVSVCADMTYERTKMQESTFVIFTHFHNRTRAYLYILNRARKKDNCLITRIDFDTHPIPVAGVSTTNKTQKCLSGHMSRRTVDFFIVWLALRLRLSAHPGLAIR